MTRRNQTSKTKGGIFQEDNQPGQKPEVGMSLEFEDQLERWLGSKPWRGVGAGKGLVGSNTWSCATLCEVCFLICKTGPPVLLNRKWTHPSALHFTVYL